MFVGTHYLGDGFVVSAEQARELIARQVRNKLVVFPLVNCDELNNLPDQQAVRYIIDFDGRTEEEAREYTEPFARVQALVYPERQQESEHRLWSKWWLFKRPFSEVRARASSLPFFFASGITTKHLSFSALPANYVFSHAACAVPTDRWDVFAVLQSSLHEAWARKRSGAHELRLRYSPSNCFETFCAPSSLWSQDRNALQRIGESYHHERRELMLSLWLGLTDIYNLFHSREIEADMKAHFVARAKKDPRGLSIPIEHRERTLAFTCNQAIGGLLELRRLHVALDNAVRDAYGWQSLDLQHDFYEIETLPENDRVRYTISPAARKEVLKRLLALNHERAKAEQAAVAPAVAKPTRAKRAASASAVEEMTVFDQAFPASAVDWETAGWMLALVRAAPQRGIAFYMACMAAAASPDLCEQILPQDRKQQTKRLMAKAPLAKQPSGTRIPFAAALRWASTTKAITTSAQMNDAQPGPTFPRAVSETGMPKLDDALVSLVIEVAEHATDATQATQPWRLAFEQRRLLVG